MTHEEKAKEAINDLLIAVTDFRAAWKRAHSVNYLLIKPVMYNVIHEAARLLRAVAKKLNEFADHAEDPTSGDADSEG